MPQSLSNVLVHLVFSTKNRTAALLSNAPLIPQDGASETLTSRRPSPEAWKFFRTDVGA
jgi:hypothetical protein